MNDIVGEAFYGLCKTVDSPISLGLWLRYEHAHSELAKASIDPKAYNTAESFYKDYVCVNALRKYEGLDTGIDTEEAALQAFDKAEEQCRLFNEASRTYATTGRLGQIELEVLLRVQELIARVWDNPKLSTMFQYCGWGPGATATLKGASATTEGKMSELPLSATPTAFPYLRMVMKDDYAWLRHLFQMDVVAPVSLLPSCFHEIHGSRLLVVPKDAKIGRVIAAEPTGNIFLQKGIGGYLRRRLRKFGVNLDDQTRNQVLAEKAGILHLATLDLSAASDTISIGLCKALLPPDMFKILDDLRSPSYTTTGLDRIRFHKFSSMGNGFTFELESLIFWATAKAVYDMEECQGPIGVYGDDIIVPQRIAQRVIAVLEGFGFNINKQKSFVEGRFFESCGKHYFDGVDVTPFYQKHVVDHDLEVCRFVNRVYEVAYKRPYLDAEVYFGKIHSRLFSKLPKKMQVLTAPGWVEGDGFFRVKNHHGRSSANFGYQIHYMEAKKPAEVDADGGLYAYALRKGGTARRDASSCEGSDFVELKFEDPMRAKVYLVCYDGVLSAEKLLNIAYNGKVMIRPRGVIKTYKRTKRWVPLSKRNE